MKENIWIRIFGGIGHVPRMDETNLRITDNQSGMKLDSTELNCRTKQIDFRFHFKRQAVKDGPVYLKHCPTEEMMAEMLKKGLGRMKLENLCMDAVLGSECHRRDFDRRAC